MGRIKTQFIKRTSNDLLTRHSDKFTTDFEQNKIVVGQVTDVQSKKVRNIIAGYLSRLVRNRKDF